MRLVKLLWLSVLLLLIILCVFFAVVWSERLLLAATAADCGGCHDGDVMQMGMSNITKAVT